jgi:hypothetical protein
MKYILFLIGTCNLWSQCTPGVNTVVDRHGNNVSVTVIQAFVWSSFITSPLNEGNKIDIFYLTSYGSGQSNKAPIMLDVHGGAFSRTAATIQTNYCNQMLRIVADNGVNIYSPYYTVNSMWQLGANLNPGDTTATIQFLSTAGLSSPTNGYCPTNQTGISMNVASAGSITISSMFPCGDNSNHVVNLSANTVGTTQTSGTFLFIPGITHNTMQMDIAGLLAFFAKCSSGGSSYNSGVCTGFTAIPGNPKLIRGWCVSAGCELMVDVLQGGCWQLSTCTLLNNTPSTPGYHEYDGAGGWSFYNPTGAYPIVLTSMSDLTCRTMQLSATFTNADAMMLATAQTITGTGSFNTTTLLWSGIPSAGCIASNIYSPLSNAQSGLFPIPFIINLQAGATDGDFYQDEVLMGQADNHYIINSFAGLSHALDFLTANPATASVGFQAEEANLGYNNCIGNQKGCPATSGPVF